MLVMMSVSWTHYIQYSHVIYCLLDLIVHKMTVERSVKADPEDFERLAEKEFTPTDAALQMEEFKVSRKLQMCENAVLLSRHIWGSHLSQGPATTNLVDCEKIS